MVQALNVFACQECIVFWQVSTSFLILDLEMDKATNNTFSLKQCSETHVTVETVPCNAYTLNKFSKTLFFYL